MGSYCHRGDRFEKCWKETQKEKKKDDDDLFFLSRLDEKDCEEEGE